MLLALLWLVFLLGEEALAEEFSTSTTNHRLIVGTPQGDTGLSLEGLVSALESQLSELGVLVHVSSTSLDEGFEAHTSDERVLAYVWVVRDGDTLSVHFLEAAGESLRQRRLPISSEDSSSVEAVAVVVRSAVAALLDRMTDEDDPPAEVPPKPGLEVETPRAVVTARSKHKPLLISVGWTGQSYAPELGYAHGAVWDVAVRPLQSALVFGGNYAFFAAQQSIAAGNVVSLRRHPIEVYVGADTRGKHRPLFLLAQTGFNMDLVRRKTLETGTDLVREPDTKRTSWALALRGGVGIEANSRLSLVLLSGADVLLSRVPVALATAGSEQVIVTPHRVRPRLAVQLSWQLP